MEPIIRCENVTLGYGKDIVLENLSLEIPRGVFLPFLGPNGSGKTTLLRGILGLIKPLRGKIASPFEHAPAGYVPQSKSIDPLFPLNVRDIIRMGFYPRLGWWKKTTPADERLIQEVLEELKLTDYAEKNYRDLSGGTKQKVLIARALVSGAEVFVMDEATTELDDTSETEVLTHLLKFVRENQKTVLMVHHGLQHPLLRGLPEVCRVHHGKAERVKNPMASGLGGL